MKRFILAVCLMLSTLFVHAQTNTTVKFKEINQQFEFSKNKIKIEILVINPGSYAAVSNVPLTLELFCENVTDDSFMGITNTKGIPIIIEPTENKIEVEFPVSEKVLNDHRFLTFTLKKKGLNPNFKILESGHTIVLLSKNYDKATVSITKPKSLKKFKIKTNGLESIKVPFNINVKGLNISEDDKATATISLNGKYEKSFTFYGNSTNKQFVLKQGESNVNLDSIVNVILEKEDFILKLKKLSTPSKKTLEIDQKHQEITYNIKKIEKAKARYDMFLGTNFDLKDRFEASSFYSEISAFVPNVTKVFNRDISIRGGIYKNNNSVNLEETRRQELLLSITNTTTDSITFSTNRVNTIPKVDIENLGLYFEIMGLFFESKDKRFKSYISARAETVERREKYTYNSTDLFNLGTTTISIDSLSNDIRLQNRLSDPREFTRKYYDSYYGIGFPMRYNAVNNEFEVFFNPVFGVGVPGLVLPREEDVLRGFGAFQFHIIVSSGNILGIKLGGEIRKYFAFAQDPLININLSTRINLSGALKKDEKE